MLRRLYAFGLAAAFAFAGLSSTDAAVQATIVGQVTGIVTGSSTFGTPEYDVNLKAALALANGTGAGQADTLWSSQRTIAASGTEDIDLSGALTNSLGQATVFATVKTILIIAADANTNNVVIGNAGSNGFVGPFGAATHTASIKPGGIVLFAAPGTGWTVTAATGDLLHVANSSSGTSVTYKIIVIGTSS